MVNTKTNYTLNISPLFNAVGIHKSGEISITEAAYEFYPDHPKDYWLYVAFLGFQKYAKKHGKISSFASIGTGAGIDAIGAYEIFKPKKIIVTDIHPRLPALAKRNITKNIPSNVEMISLKGDLCQPLIERKLKVDLIYANLPNLPAEERPLKNKTNVSYYLKRDPQECPEKFQKYMLTMQYLFLKEAKCVINKGGAVIDAIGGRVPYEVLKELFREAGYTFSELASVYKIATEPYFELKGYAEAEKKYGVEFDFYHYAKAQERWLKIEKKKLSGQKLKEELKKYRVCATEAYAGYLKNNNVYGRVSHILCGRI